MASERPSFRPDIEGLRGAAILLVVLFHAGVSALAGGFVGVDVFFVLSGYFITGLLAREQWSTGRIDLTAFYARRSLRLVPAMLLVLLTTLGLVMWLYAPIDRAPVPSAARAVALGAGNIQFASGAVDYFSSGENPLLHTWSLAVEQQFYVVWPLLFVAVAMLHQRRATLPAPGEHEERGDHLRTWIGAAGILSLAACVWVTRTAQPWAFFGMPTRIWEFALGGLVALRPRHDEATGDARLADPARATRFGWLQAGGLAAIAAAIVMYDRATPYPGIAALLPALGAASLIVGGERAPDSLVSRALGVRPLRWLGGLSYAWYLWHWPLVGLGAVLHPAIGVPGRLAWSLLGLALAWLTLRYIERPAREGRLSRLSVNTVAFASLVAGVLAAVLAHAAVGAAERGVARPGQRAYAAARTDRMAKSCWVNTVEELQGPCELGDLRSSTTIALLGDSHAEHWLGGLDRAGREHGWKIDAMVKGGCPVADMPEMMYPRLRRYYHECSRYREAMLRRIIAMRPAAVVLGSWDHYLPRSGGKSAWQVTPEMWRVGLRRTYQRLVEAGIRTIVIRDVPNIPFDAPACLSRRAAGLPFAGSCRYERSDAFVREAIAAQDAAARGLPVRMIDMNDQVCAAARCDVVTREGLVIFTDDNHLTAAFSGSAAPVLGARIARAMRP